MVADVAVDLYLDADVYRSIAGDGPDYLGGSFPPPSEGEEAVKRYMVYGFTDEDPDGEYVDFEDLESHFTALRALEQEMRRVHEVCETRCGGKMVAERAKDWADRLSSLTQPEKT